MAVTDRTRNLSFARDEAVKRAHKVEEAMSRHNLPGYVTAGNPRRTTSNDVIIVLDVADADVFVNFLNSR